MREKEVVEPTVNEVEVKEEAHAEAEPNINWVGYISYNVDDLMADL